MPSPIWQTRILCNELMEMYLIGRKEASYLLHTYGKKSGATYYIPRDMVITNEMILDARKRVHADLTQKRWARRMR